MKDEIDYRSCNTFDELQVMIDEYVDYYNNFRYQWNLKKLTPIQFRNQLFNGALTILFSRVLDKGFTLNIIGILLTYLLFTLLLSVLY